MLFNGIFLFYLMFGILDVIANGFEPHFLYHLLVQTFDEFPFCRLYFSCSIVVGQGHRISVVFGCTLPAAC